MEILDKEIYSVSQVKFVKGERAIEGDSASGFFYMNNDKIYFITNLHVVLGEKNEYGQREHYPDKLQLHLHKKDDDSSRVYQIKLYDDSGKPLWFQHPEFGRDVDVIALPLEDENLTSMFEIKPFQENDLIPKNWSIFLGTDLLIIGYPLGYYDTEHNLPIILAGTLASVHHIPFEGKQGFLIKSLLHPGTSGSPVTTKPPNDLIRTSQGRTKYSKDPLKKYLVGIHSEALDRSNPSLDLNFVWFSFLIKDIIERKIKGEAE